MSFMAHYVFGFGHIAIMVGSFSEDFIRICCLRYLGRRRFWNLTANVYDASIWNGTSSGDNNANSFWNHPSNEYF